MSIGGRAGRTGGLSLTIFLDSGAGDDGRGVRGVDGNGGNAGEVIWLKLSSAAESAPIDLFLRWLPMPAKPLRPKRDAELLNAGRLLDDDDDEYSCMNGLEVERP